VPAAIKTPPFPNALLRAHGTDRQFHLPTVGKFEVARNNMPGTALDDESGALREPAGKPIGWAHRNLLKMPRSKKATRGKFARRQNGSNSDRTEVPISVSCCGDLLQRPLSLGKRIETDATVAGSAVRRLPSCCAPTCAPQNGALVAPGRVFRRP
jgi:hypothetical protein